MRHRLFSICCLCSSLFALQAQPAPRPLVDVFTSGQEGYASFRIPSLLATSERTLLAFAEGRVHPHDHAENDIVLKRSTDRGATWSPLKVIQDAGEDALNNPTTVLLKDSGRILLVYQRYARGFDERRAEPGLSGPRICRTFLISSHDDGITWTEPADITAQVKRPTEVTSTAAGPGIGIQLRGGKNAGRILVPFNQGPYGRWKVYAVFSDDLGATWRYGDTAPEGSPGFANEVQFAELSNGVVMLNARNQSGARHRKIAFSINGGETWSVTQDDPALIEPACQASLLAVPTSATGTLLLFANPASTSSRTNGTLRVSRDEGKSWPSSISIYPGSFAYSSLAALPGGAVACLFERDDYKRISLARFSADELAAP